MKPSLPSRHLSRQITALIHPRCAAIAPQALPSTPSRPSSTRPTTTPQQSHLTTPKTRSFHLPSLSSFLPNNNGNNNNDNKRTLTATRTLPYSPQALYKVISSVESYSSFLPFLTASTVTARCPETGAPTRAFLTIGYGPLSETFTSQVTCDPERWIVEARSGEKFGVDSKGGQDFAKTSSSSSSGSGGPLGGLFPGANEGIFEYLSTRWELVPEEGGQERTTVKLEIRFEFKNQLHAAMMGAVEGQMAGVMIEAFEKRIREIEGR